MPRRITDAERIHKYVTKSDGLGCWLWAGAVTAAGYGVFTSNYRNQYAHRWMYELHVGPIPAGMDLDHLCRMRHCVRPDHLEPVTRKVNLNRGAGRGGALA